MTYNNGTVNRMMVMKILDHKPVSLLSTVYDTKDVAIGKSHWKNGVDIVKPEIMHQYNRFMGGVDQLLQYQGYLRKSLK